MQVFWPASLRRLVPGLLLAAAALVTTAALVLPAAASTPPSPPAARPDLPPGTVVIPGRASEYATHYQLPDGRLLCDLSSSRVNFRDSDGGWRAIDSRLVPSPAIGVSRNAANDLRMEFAGRSSGRRPVRVSKDDWSVEIAPLFGLPGDHFDQLNVAVFPEVAHDTDLEYSVQPDRLKETVVLSSHEAPTLFTFEMRTTGLDLRHQGDEWLLFRSGGFTPELRLGELVVTDAAGVCASGASMTVTANSTGALITYSIPRAWLDDPARSFPVEVDPTMEYVQTNAVADTFVSSEFPTSTSGGTQTIIKVGNTSSANTYKGFVRFDMSAAGIPASGYPETAQLRFVRRPGSRRQRHDHESWRGHGDVHRGGNLPVTFSSRP